MFHMGGMLLALGGARFASVGAKGTRFAVERRLIAHQGDAGLAGRGAVKTGFETRFHPLHANTRGGAHFALGETIKTSCNAGLHRGRLGRVTSSS